MKAYETPKAALKKFFHHLWYLTDEKAVSSLFDEEVDQENMGFQETRLKRIIVFQAYGFMNLTISSFVPGRGALCRHGARALLDARPRVARVLRVRHALLGLPPPPPLPHLRADLLRPLLLAPRARSRVRVRGWAARLHALRPGRTGVPAYGGRGGDVSRPAHLTV